MTKVRCNTCVGSGKVMGGGMMQQDCDECDGRGKLFIDETKKFVIDKNSKHYKEAIRNIKALNKNISHEEAEDIFEEEMVKLDSKDGTDDTAKTSNKTDKRAKSNAGYDHCDILPA